MLKAVIDLIYLNFKVHQVVKNADKLIVKGHALL